MKKYIPILLLLPLAFLSSCRNTDGGADAYGNFETTEVDVSAEIPGKLISFIPEEGQTLEAGQKVGQVDTVQMELQIRQLEAKRAAIASKTSNVFAQLAVLEEQNRVLEIERQRIEKLLQAEAATPQQMDNINGKISVNQSQYKSIETQNAGVVSEVRALDFQIDQIRDQIRRAAIFNPVSGTVLLKLTEPSEMVNPGKTLYKIAPLDELYLRAYLSGDQLAQVKLGQEVTVRIDDGKETMRDLRGTISWISSQAEFTPKIVQTKEERVNLVYAFKVRVPNDGSLKIGMPGEVVFGGNTTQSEAPQAQNN
ncbi:MAG: HlyD family efflux transporter periplasmic adaptor subunit [Bacteroidia bacterium]|nr:HlyD family efflux transporter periplasmic adaptor subunit [Bacteroidia bacterium]